MWVCALKQFCSAKASNLSVALRHKFGPRPNFSRMRSKGSRFTLGSGGWGCVRSTLRLCSQPSATVCGRPCERRMAVPMVSSAKGVTIGGFKRRVALFRVAGVALRDIQTCFVTRRNRFVWQAQYLCVVFRRWVPVFLEGAALWMCPSSFCVGGAAF